MPNSSPQIGGHQSPFPGEWFSVEKRLFTDMIAARLSSQIRPNSGQSRDRFPEILSRTVQALPKPLACWFLRRPLTVFWASI